MASRPLDDLRELERADLDLARRVADLRALDEEVAAVRARAEMIDAFFAAYPDADDRLRVEAADADRHVEARRAEVTEAQALVDQARDGDARVAAERVLVRARDHLSVAEARVLRVAAERDAFELAAAHLPEELPSLGERAAAVSDALTDVAAPHHSPRDLIEWAGRAHAALFVAAGQLDTQRDRVIREANELASMLLGEPTFGATPSQARARVEAALAAR